MHSMSLVSKFGTSHSSPAQITANGLSFDVNIQDGVELVFLFIHIYTNILIFVITAMFRQLYSLTFFRCLPINGGGRLSMSKYILFFFLFTFYPCSAISYRFSIEYVFVLPTTRIDLTIIIPTNLWTPIPGVTKLWPPMPVHPARHFTVPQMS